MKRFRGALRGTTYRRSRKETRGRKRKLSRKAVLKMNVVRKRLIKKVDQQREVRWEDIHKASRAPKTHRSTLGRCRAVPNRWFLHGVGVSWGEGKALGDAGGGVPRVEPNACPAGVFLKNVGFL